MHDVEFLKAQLAAITERLGEVEDVDTAKRGPVQTPSSFIPQVAPPKVPLAVPISEEEEMQAAISFDPKMFRPKIWSRPSKHQSQTYASKKEGEGRKEKRKEEREEEEPVAHKQASQPTSVLPKQQVAAPREKMEKAQVRLQQGSPSTQQCQQLQHLMLLHMQQGFDGPQPQVHQGERMVDEI